MSEGEQSPKLSISDEKPELPEPTERHAVYAAAPSKAETTDRDAPLKGATQEEDVSSGIPAQKLAEASADTDGIHLKTTEDDSEEAPPVKEQQAASQSAEALAQQLTSPHGASQERNREGVTASLIKHIGSDTANETEAEAGSKLADDFEEVTVDDLNDISLEDHKENNEISDGSLDKVRDTARPGVTSAPPNPSQNPTAATNVGSLGSTSPFSNSKRSASIANELTQAEEAADSAALSTSLRANGLGKKSAPAVDIPGEDQATFTEENLQSGQTTPSPARPFSPPPTAARTFTEAGRVDTNEPEEFKGLVYNDGVDSQGRPVIVINADALPAKVSRNAACAYLLQRLEPIILQGPYVAVFLSTGTKSKSNKITAGWLASCYRQMSYPFRKNVKFVILVRPSAMLNILLALVKPLISKKAWVKIKKVDRLSGIEEATNRQVSLQHLGSRFTTIAGGSIIQAEGAGFGQGSVYQMPNIAAGP